MNFISKIAAATLFHLPAFVSLASAAPGVFEGIPETREIEDVARYRSARVEAVIREITRTKPDTYIDSTNGGTPILALAFLASGKSVDEVNRVILDPRTRVFSNSGTSFDSLGPICRRRGDYDFTLRGWIPVIYRYWDQPHLLTPAARSKILHTLLNERGSAIALRRRICGLPIPESENHILMTEGSRYLTNQLLNRERRELGQPENPAWNNTRNGMRAFFVRHLQELREQDFSEYNSVPYQHYTTLGILNLVDYAEDTDVRDEARALMDLLDRKFALMSIDLMRYAPFRRREEYRERDEMIEADGEATRFLALIGHSGSLARLNVPYSPRGGYDAMLQFGLSSYNVAERLLPYFLLHANPDSRTAVLTRWKARAAEITYKEPRFLINAGGTHYIYHALLTHEDGLVVPTTLIPRDGPIRISRLLRFLGGNNHRSTNNTCVAEQFLCGVNLRWPEGHAESCLRREGQWVFIDASHSSACASLRWGTYIAVYQNYCRDRACAGTVSNWGFAHVVSQEEASSFLEFSDRILRTNGSKTYYPSRIDSFTRYDGSTVRFRALSPDERESLIYESKGVTVPRWTTWPHVQQIDSHR